MPDAWEMLVEAIAKKVVEIYAENIDFTDETDYNVQIGQLQILVWIQSEMFRILNAIKDFEDTVSGSGG